jgi:hypothetical protein
VSRVRLSLGGEIDSRPFASPTHTEHDQRVMQGMLERLRALAPRWATESRSFLVREPDAEGFRHWIRVPDCQALVSADRFTVVGVFGQARDDVEHRPIHELEAGIVDTLETITGVLCYYDVALPTGGYGNLILCATPDAPTQVHGNALHRRAVAITPRHYHSVRLHTGLVPGRLFSDAELVIERTHYYDYDVDPAWLAVREFT